MTYTHRVAGRVGLHTHRVAGRVGLHTHRVTGRMGLHTHRVARRVGLHTHRVTGRMGLHTHTQSIQESGATHTHRVAGRVGATHIQEVGGGGLPMAQMMLLLSLLRANAVARLEGTIESSRSITPLHAQS